MLPAMAAAYPTSTCRPAARTALTSTRQRVISRGAILTSINRGTPATYVLVSYIASAIWQCGREHPCWGRETSGGAKLRMNDTGVGMRRRWKADVNRRSDRQPGRPDGRVAPRRTGCSVSGHLAQRIGLVTPESAEESMGSQGCFGILIRRELARQGKAAFSGDACKPAGLG